MYYLHAGFLAKIHNVVLIFLMYARGPAHHTVLDFTSNTNTIFRVKIMQPLCNFL